MHDAAALQPAPASLRALRPIFAPLLERRSWCIYLATIGIAHLALSRLGLPGLGCIVREYTGVPCPGCGLTHASLDLLEGRWAAAIATHAFAPVFLIGLGLIAFAVVLPASVRRSLALRVAAFERRTWIVPLLTVGLILYWWARLS